MSPAGGADDCERLRLAARVFRHLDPDSSSWESWDDLVEIGGALEASAETLPLASKLQAAGLLETDADLATAPHGTAIPVKLTLIALRSSRAYFARDLGELLEQRVRSRFDPPACFFLAEVPFLAELPGAESGYLHPDEEEHPPERVTRYLRTLRLVRLLERVSDYRDEHGDQRTLVFVQRGVLRLPVDYTADDLALPGDSRPAGRPAPGDAGTGPDGLDKIERLLDAEVHRDQIRDLLKATLLETLRDTDQRFVDLLRGLGRLIRNFNDDYALFISEFSFEKVREQAEEHRLTYTDKLNGLFAGIQNRLLTIPVALVIAAGGMKNEAGATFGNSMILLGAAVFALLMWLLITNQEDTLECLHREIGREGGKIALTPEIHAKLSDVYEDLERRYRHHRRLLFWIRLLVVLSLLLPLGVFLHDLAPLLWWR